MKPIDLVNSKEIYNKLICEKITEPTATNKWLVSYPFLEKINWKAIYEIPFSITKETYLHTFQFKILNRIMNCNEKLKTWAIKTSEKCSYCDHCDTIEHHLFECHTSRKLWDQLEKWFADTLQIFHEFTICEIIFGVINIEKHKNTLNYTILLTKWYINNTKTQNKELLFLDLLIAIRQRIEITIQNKNIIGEYENENNWQLQLYDSL